MSGAQAPIELVTQEVELRPGDRVTYAITEREQCDHLVVLTPGALNNDRPDRLRPVYNRWSWAVKWPTATVMNFADPALRTDPRLNGAWFVDRERDYAAELAAVVRSKAARLGLGHEHIVFYGSSLGGFGALMLAALVPGSRAVAEVPQIRVARWLPSAVTAIESYILGEPLADFEARFPERVDVRARLEQAGHCPGILLITNLNDRTYADHVDFLRWATSSELPRSGPVEMLVTNRVHGHAVLQRDVVTPLVTPHAYRRTA